MTSFVFQPWKEDDEAPSSPLHPLKEKEKEAVTSSTVIKRSIKSSIKSSLHRTPDTLKKSITLEQRGITYGKKVESISSIQQADQIRRTPKIDCSHGPSEMIQQPAILLVGAYAGNNPEPNQNSTPISSPAKSASEPSEVNGKEPKVGGGVAPLNGEIGVVRAKVKEGNSSAIRQKKYQSKMDTTPWILLLILVLLILSFKTEAGREFFMENLLIPYKQHLYASFFE